MPSGAVGSRCPLACPATFYESVARERCPPCVPRSLQNASFRALRTAKTNRRPEVRLAGFQPSLRPHRALALGTCSRPAPMLPSQTCVESHRSAPSVRNARRHSRHGQTPSSECWSSPGARGTRELRARDLPPVDNSLGPRRAVPVEYAPRPFAPSASPLAPRAPWQLSKRMQPHPGHSRTWPRSTDTVRRLGHALRPGRGDQADSPRPEHSRFRGTAPRA
jgi:hypothetical protein